MHRPHRFSAVRLAQNLTECGPDGLVRSNPGLEVRVSPFHPLLGIGGKQVSDAENQALDEISSALGAPPAT